ncbi:MAG: tRNA preQ1(34) S-adenosylmethionine ribosyltransferase-isomerase QueA [Gammaproteobacteria bacterium]|nr:tRNA preQ1(34) S-adenosylmethionine ribosyltransferase-isomerase QueA [Gammaproteobacteria bacterium]
MQPGPSSLEEFAYDLPPDLIAQAPLAERTASHLLHVHPDGRSEDLHIPDIADVLHQGDLLVVNDTRVLPARLFGRKATGGKVEMLLERLIDERTARVQLRSSRSPGIGTELTFDGGVPATVADRDGRFFVLEFAEPLEPVLERHGHVPLPPYIERPDDATDRARYQTVFSRAPGAVAAPTAALHFDDALLGRLRAKGVGIETVTLHVGAGTFAPLRTEQLESGRLHAERVEVPEPVCAAAERAHAAGRRVVALGTTTMRALESAALGTGSLAPFSGETTLFIRPGFRFRVADALLTNFHLPRSSLLMLVCAFAGTQSILAAYAHAVRHRYRFFSYGDAMFCHRQI